MGFLRYHCSCRRRHSHDRITPERMRRTGVRGETKSACDGERTVYSIALRWGRALPICMAKPDLI